MKIENSDFIDFLLIMFVLIFLIIIILMRCNVFNKIENFTSFSKTQKLRDEYKKIYDKGLNNDAKKIYDKLEKIDCPNNDDTKKEIDILLNHQNEKDLHSHKIQAENQRIKDKDYDRLNVDFEDRERINKFIKTILGPIIMKMKIEYDRSRPTFFDKRVKNIIDIPPSPSYPSGHACQSYAIALLLSKKYPENKDFYMNNAKLVAENREIAGLHYPSDTEYGMKLAHQIVELSNFEI